MTPEETLALYRQLVESYRPTDEMGNRLSLFPSGRSLSSPSSPSPQAVEMNKLPSNPVDPNDPWVQAEALKRDKNKLAEPGVIERLLYMMGVGRQ